MSIELLVRDSLTAMIIGRRGSFESASAASDLAYYFKEPKILS
jgi:hypothetical protein